jgi:hypothetical protein
VKKRILAKGRRAIARLAGWVAPRPKNLIIVPRHLMFRESSGGAPDDRRVIGVGHDMAQVIAGCGGLLFLHKARGGICEIFVSVPLREEEREMAHAAGMLIGSVAELRDRLDEGPVVSSLCLLPFPPGAGSFIVGRFPRILFYESGFLLLPDTIVDISDHAGKKLDFLSGIGGDRNADLAEALSAYRSGSTREGKGWCECYLSLEAMKSVASTYSGHRERESILQFLSAIDSGPLAE